MRAGVRVAADLAAGFGLLTRLPVGWLVRPRTPYRPGRAVWTYPLAGLVVGAAMAATRALGLHAGLSPLLCAGWAIGVAALLTGGLHEDGLADAADGFGGGRTPERRLEIMRDSRIGSYGAIALVLAMAIRLAALAALPTGRATAALLAAGALSRAAMLPVLTLPPARTDGLGRGLGRVPPAALALGGLLAAMVAVAVLPVPRALAALVGATLVALAMRAMARQRLVGQTGDVLGATCIAAECVLLTLLSVP